MPMSLASDFEVEHYLDHQAKIFVERFDALSYLYLTRVMDYFDPFADPQLALAPGMSGEILMRAKGCSDGKL